MSKYRLEIYKGRGVQPWRWRVRARNGQTVMGPQEGFSRKTSARRNFETCLLALARLAEEMGIVL
jgi:uncharacterized protein YegP (UPF0339 family)